jgi:hypothetical protein
MLWPALQKISPWANGFQGPVIRKEPRENSLNIQSSKGRGTQMTIELKQKLNELKVTLEHLRGYL